MPDHRRRPEPTSEEGSSESVAIYGLADPRTGAIRYVGKSVQPFARLDYHLAPRSRRVDNVKNRWLNELLAAGLKPTLIILQWVTDANWAERERAWICQGRMIGWDLVNTSDGGEGVLPNTPESRERAAERRRELKPKRRAPRKPPAPGRSGKGDSSSIAVTDRISLGPKPPPLRSRRKK
jgi:hypothetical protein